MSTTPGKRGRSLTAALSKVAEPAAAALEASPPVMPEPAPSKRLVAVTLYVTAEDHDRLRDLSHFSKTSLQVLGAEAWNLLLDKRGHGPLTATTANRPSGRRRG